MRKQKYHLYLSDSERSFAIQNLIWFQSKLRQEGRYTDAVNDLIVKFLKAKPKKIRVTQNEPEKASPPSPVFLYSQQTAPQCPVSGTGAHRRMVEMYPLRTSLPARITPTICPCSSGIGIALQKAGNPVFGVVQVVQPHTSTGMPQHPSGGIVV